MSRRLPVVLTPAEIEQLLTAARAAADDANTAGRSYRAWREFVMIEVGILAGPRIAELCSLKVANIDLPGTTLHIIEGKGSKDRNVKIGPKLARVLLEWIGERKEGWLFPGPKGKRLSERAVQVRLVKLFAKAGINRAKAHPHIFRHTFATTLHKKGVSLRVIQVLLGHSSIATTQIYTHVDNDEMQDAVDRL